MTSGSEVGVSDENVSGDLSGRVVLITGANTGIGRATAVQLARRGADLYLACRSEERARPVVEQITAITGRRPRFLRLDLADLTSVRACALEFLGDDKPLHVLLNNAGVGGQRGLTASGFELAFGINHVGHFLLTELLLDRLKDSAPARVVTVSSDAHFAARGIDFAAVRRPTASRTGLPEYTVSKLANVVFSQELARRLDGTGVTTYAVHPGMVASDVWRGVPWPIRPIMKLFMRSTEAGAATSVHCATAPELAGESGRYYADCAPKEPSEHATTELAEELWRRSAEWVADYR
jgi:NAD(P)-dependent dehydrogenase (short-subunit alcohol dehydrogenase family)|uniref:SDR family oxidoreductase n=1 Tax=Thermocrispum agreste TaxID=37925 RepID=A0A2W4JE27_9PSEU|nr:MAG: SDR family oxidoreductase [Thermocrispum agreste]